MQRLRQPQARPNPDERAEKAARDEDVAPRCGGQHQLTETRRQDRHREKHHEHERHDAGHPASRILVPHGGAHHGHARGSDAVQTAPGEKRLEAAREPARERGRHVQGQAPEQHRPSAEPIGEHPPEKLSETETRHVGGHDPLAVIRIGHAERPHDGGQRGQHAVDGERLGRLHRRGERDEFDKTHGSRRAGSPSDGTESFKF